MDANFEVRIAAGHIHLGLVDSLNRALVDLGIEPRRPTIQEWVKDLDVLAKYLIDGTLPE